MRLVNWLLRLAGHGDLARLNSQAHRLARLAGTPDASAPGPQQGFGPPQQGFGAPQQGFGAPQQAPTSGGFGAYPAGFHAQQQAAFVEQQRAQQAAAQAQQNAFMQQVMVGAMASHQQGMNAVIAQNPALTAPIEGVTLEQYAQLTAEAARNQSPQAFEQLLHARGLDRARYDRVAAGWIARMRDDTTHTLTTLYGRAFGGAGAGQFGAAGAAGAAALGGMAQSGQGQAVAGGEPVSWDKYNEIGGAQRAWAQSGKDVNAMLQSHFGISAVDWSNMSQYWMGRMMTEPQRMMEMSTLQDQWAARYAAPRADADLRF